MLGDKKIETNLNWDPDEVHPAIIEWLEDTWAKISAEVHTSSSSDGLLPLVKDDNA